MFNFKQARYSRFPDGRDYWCKKSLSLISAICSDGMSTAYLVFNPKTTDLNYFNEGAFQPHLSAVPNAVRAWEGADIYTIPTEAKVQEYSDDSIIFFPKAMVIPQLSPLGRPAYACI